MQLSNVSNNIWKFSYIYFIECQCFVIIVYIVYIFVKIIYSSCGASSGVPVMNSLIEPTPVKSFMNSSKLTIPSSSYKGNRKCLNSIKMMSTLSTLSIISSTSSSLNLFLPCFVKMSPSSAALTFPSPLKSKTYMHFLVKSTVFFCRKTFKASLNSCVFFLIASTSALFAITRANSGNSTIPLSSLSSMSRN